MGKSLLMELIRAEEPLEPLKEELIRLWTYQGGPANEFLHEREQATSSLERELFELYFDLYHDLSEQNARIASSWKGLLESYERVLIFDALSLREAAIFKHRLESNGYRIDLNSAQTVVPSDTQQGFRRYIYDPKSDEKVDGFAMERGELDLAMLSKGLLWCSYPDALLHTRNEDFSTALERTWAVLEKLLAGKDSEETLITADHGYIYSADNSYLWKEEAETAKQLAQLFGNQRLVAVTEENREALEGLSGQFIVGMDEEYAYVLGRRRWSFRGRRPVMMHGGVSLLECLVPVMVVVRR